MSMDNETIAKAAAAQQQMAAMQNCVGGYAVPAPGGQTPAMDWAYREALAVFQRAHAYRQDEKFMDDFRTWIRRQTKDLALLLDSI